MAATVATSIDRLAGGNFLKRGSMQPSNGSRTTYCRARWNSAYDPPMVNSFVEMCGSSGTAYWESSDIFDTQLSQLDVTLAVNKR